MPSIRIAPGPALGNSLGVVVLLLATSALAADTVYVSVGDRLQAKTRLTGEVLEYNGEVLKLRMSTGTERTFPAGKVLGVEPERSTAHREADLLFAERKFQAALDRYMQAQEQESRLWVRRMLIQQIVWCYRDLGNLEMASRYFLALLEDDPQTPYFDAIPLQWTPGQPSPQLEQQAIRWMTSPQAAERLLAASFLMSSPQRQQALQVVGKLQYDNDPRIAALATAQTWRTELVTASVEDVKKWRAQADAMPEAFRAGAYYLIGSALARHLEAEQAALYFLRVTVLYPRHRTLAARCLLEAGRQLEKLGQRQDAARLYQEVLHRHADTPAETEAKSRLDSLNEKS